MWVHNLSPFILKFTESFGIRWYGMAYLTGFVAAGILMTFLSRRGRRTIQEIDVMDFVTYTVFGTMIGGRLGYAVFYSQDLLTSFGGAFPYWGLLKVWEGGMASHGGILGVLGACFLFARRHKLDWRHLGDLVVLGGSVGIFFGRIANFINGELFGRPCDKNFPLAVQFPQEMHLWLKTESEPNLAGAAANASGDMLAKMSGAVQALGTSLESWQQTVSQVRISGAARNEVSFMIERLIAAVQSGNESVRSALGLILTPRHPSQLYESLLEGLLLFILAFAFWYKPRKPGAVGGMWLTVYAVVRIIGEQFRMPDAHIGYQLFGLTRGQWISFGMLAASILVWIWCARRDAEVISGWGPEAQRLLKAETTKPSTNKGRKK
jgi:phosphatidylglycerol---prolipoprotein diacylglyceryl transferase